MDRRSFLRATGTGAAIAASPFIAAGCQRDAPPPQLPQSSSYYVASDGDDQSSGDSPDNPWQTIQRVNQALGAGAVTYGDAILFRRGDTFFGELRAPAEEFVKVGGARILLSAYGDGPRPSINAYKLLHDPAAWSEWESDTWRIDLSDGVSYGGNTANTDSNAGFLRVDGQINGAKRFSFGDLAEQWDFYNDQRHLYVKSAGPPTSLASDLRVAVDGILISGFSGLSVKGLELVGCGGHGYQQTTATGTEVSDCQIHEIGGSQLHEGDPTRYGNGIELWMGSADALLVGNEIFDVYDAATTVQGWQEGDARLSITNCAFRSNHIWNCTQAFEFWASGGDSRPNTGLVDCSFADNVCVNAGLSWGYAARDDSVHKGNFVMVHSQELAMGVTVTSNIFFDARDCYLFVSTDGNRLRPGIVLDHNTIALRADTPIQADLGYSIEQSREWVSTTGQDRSSRWVVVPPSMTTPDETLRYVRQHADELRTRR